MPRWRRAAVTPASPTASSTSWARNAVPAAWTAELTIPAPADPTAEVLLGRSVSPACTSMACRATPSASAPTCVAIVSTPVPISCVEVCTTALPSARMRARARCGGMKNATGYAAAAIPVPSSQSPSRLERGAGSRSLQPNRSAPSRRHSSNPSLDQGFPWGSVGARSRRRSSTGSMPSSWASSSMAVSSVKTPSVSPGPRVNVGVIVLPATSRWTPR